MWIFNINNRNWWYRKSTNLSYAGTGVLKPGTVVVFVSVNLTSSKSVEMHQSCRKSCLETTLVSTIWTFRSRKQTTHRRVANHHSGLRFELPRKGLHQIHLAAGLSQHTLLANSPRSRKRSIVVSASRPRTTRHRQPGPIQASVCPILGWILTGVPSSEAFRHT